MVSGINQLQPQNQFQIKEMNQVQTQIQEKQQEVGKLLAGKGQKQTEQEETKTRKYEGLPPGLAKREELPPGLAKRDELPPGLAKKLKSEEAESTSETQNNVTEAPAAPVDPEIASPDPNVDTTNDLNGLMQQLRLLQEKFNKLMADQQLQANIQEQNKLQLTA